MTIEFSEPQETFIPVFVDVKPNEVIKPSTKKKLCFVGLLSSNVDGVSDLAQYKDTRRKRKAKTAAKIIDCLKRGELQVDVIAVTGKMNGLFAKWACDTINTSREEIGAEWVVERTSPKQLNWKDHTFDVSSALGLSLYAGVLPLIGLRAAIVCKDSPIKKIKIAMDHLPHCSVKGSELINALFEADPDISKMWQSNLSEGFSFQTGIFESYINDDGDQISGKSHPNAILVDWMAVGCMAVVCPQQLKEESHLSDEEILVFSELWNIAKATGSASLIDVDDQGYIDRITDHEKKRKG